MFIEKEKHKNVNVETLGVDGSKLPPLIDWDNLPDHITLKRVLEFIRYFVDEQKESLEDVKLILENIRFVDYKQTIIAIQELSIKLKAISESENTYLLTDGKSKSSRVWICEEISKITGIPLISIDNVDTVRADSTLILADDLMIFGEQSSNLIGLALKKVPSNVKFIEAFIAATNSFDNGFRRSAIKQGSRVIRVFEVPTVSEMYLNNFKNQNFHGLNILTFFNHKVSDRFLHLLTRSDSFLRSDGKNKWVVDDLLVDPPYYPGKFSKYNVKK